jgi:hypothetical protein
MGLGFGLVLAAPVLAPVLTLAHATDRGPGGGHFAGTVLPVLLLGIVTRPVIQLVMLVAAHLRAYSTGGGTRSCTANPATDMWVAGRRCAVCGIGGDGIAIVDIQLHLLAALALERHHRLRLGRRCCAQQHQQVTPRERTHGTPPPGGKPVSQNSSPLMS